MKDFKPTWLYIKQHNVTGLKYFGKTTRNPNTYTGSGKYWIRHLKKHGTDISTIWVQKFTDKERLIKFAISFSKENLIVESNLWANLKEENGLDGGSYGEHSPEALAKILAANIGKQNTPEQIAKWRAKVKGSKRTKEFCEKIRVAKLGKARPKKLCPICFKQINVGNLSRHIQAHTTGTAKKGIPRARKNCLICGKNISIGHFPQHMKLKHKVR